MAATHPVSAEGVAHVGDDSPWSPASGGERTPATSGMIAEARFPRAARLELDTLLEQMVSRARDVQETQGRLCRLLRANLAVARGVDPEEVLRHIADAARELVHARYAAIGAARAGRLVRFVHTGADDDVVARIDRLLDRAGVAELLVDQPRRGRLRGSAEHPRPGGAHGYEAPTCSLLSAPVRVGDRMFGSLYLAEKQGADEFTAEDEDLLAALAAAAGVAIENASTFVECRRRQQWQAGMVAITTQLLTVSEPDQALRQMVQHAMRASDADAASVTVPTSDPGLLRVAVAEGGFRGWQGEIFPVEGSASAIAMAERRAVLVADLSSDPRIRVAGHCLDEVGAAVIAPVAGDRDVTGALIVSRSRDKGPFDATDLDMIAGFAGQAALVLQLAEARRHAERLRMVEDRQRIGEDLQHSVIQRLFALGLSIQAVAGRVGDTEVKRMLTDRVEEIDDIIRDIRATVFALRTPGQGD